MLQLIPKTHTHKNKARKQKDIKKIARLLPPRTIVITILESLKTFPNSDIFLGNDSL